jgi:hypothetical protein
MTILSHLVGFLCDSGKTGISAYAGKHQILLLEFTVIKKGKATRFSAPLPFLILFIWFSKSFYLPLIFFCHSVLL